MCSNARTRFEIVDPVCLAQDRDHWRAVANTVMNTELYKMLGISGLDE